MAKEIIIDSPKYGQHIALVDEEDYDRVRQYKWWIDKHTDKRFYCRTFMEINGRIKYVRMHRFILNIYDPKIKIDHKNEDGRDNRRENLRFCNHEQNGYNTSGNHDYKSTFKGVYKDERRNGWFSQIRALKKNFFIGRFDTKLDAAKAYNIVCVEIRGEFAKPNKIDMSKISDYVADKANNTIKRIRAYERDQ